MPSRPRGSYSSLATLGLSAMTDSRVRKIRGDMDTIMQSHDSLSSAIHESRKVTLNAIRTVGELQLATMIHLRDMDTKLNEISGAMWDLKKYFKDKDERLAYLRGICLDVEHAIEFIESYSHKYPEYAIYQLEGLQAVLQNNGVTPERFNQLGSIADAERGRNSISSVDALHSQLTKSLGA